jgi:hypothetical protein
MDIVVLLIYYGDTTLNIWMQPDYKSSWRGTITTMEDQSHQMSPWRLCVKLYSICACVVGLWHNFTSVWHWAEWWQTGPSQDWETTSFSLQHSF